MTNLSLLKFVFSDQTSLAWVTHANSEQLLP